MKTFKRFLRESYLNEESTNRERSPKEQAVWDKINAREAERAARKAERGSTGAAARPDLQYKRQLRITTSSATGGLPPGRSPRVGYPGYTRPGIDQMPPDPWETPSQKLERQRGIPSEGPSSRRPERRIGPASSPTSPPPGAGRGAGTPPPPPGAGRGAGTPPPPPGAGRGAGTPPVTPTPKSGIKWKPTLGKIGTAAGIAIPSAMEYKQRRDEGQSKAKAAGGVLTTAAAYGLGAKIASPIPNPIYRGAASLALGTAFATGAKPAYDWAVEKTRPARQAISKATGVSTAKKVEDLTQKIQRSGAAKPTPTHDWSKEKGKDWATLTRGSERKIYVPQIGWQFPATVNKERGKAGLPPVKDPGQPKSSTSPKGTPDYFKASSQARSTIGTRGAREIASQKGVYGTRKGSALLGTSTPATVNRQARTITTGGKTASLAPTQLVRDPKSGKQKVGDLAFRGNKAVYLARPSIQSRDTSLTARVGRALNLGRYSKEAESKAAKQEYRTALKSTQKYTKQLGITPQSATQQKLPGYGVGPKKVGPKIVGPKKVGAAKPVSPGSTLIKPA